MSIGFSAIVAALESHALSLGVFDKVGRHEPMNAPGNGIEASIWVNSMEPVRMSGLNATSVCVVLNVRYVTPMMHEPQDDIDVNLMDATDVLCDAYNDDLTLDGLISWIDVFGSQGIERLRLEAGYLDVDSVTYRMYQLYVPCIVDAVWTQAL